MKILALLMMFCAPAFAQWTPEQRTLATIYMAAHVVDWGQTRAIAKNHHRWEELNPTLGRKPSMSRVNAHFIIAPLIGYTILDNMSSESRTTWLRTLAQMQVAIAANNAHVGIHVSF